MNTISRLTLGLAAAAMLAGCSDDEKFGGQEPVIDPVGQSAYMKISIADVNSIAGKSTSTPTEDNGFKYGSYNEHKVAHAQFFFFDEGGQYVLEGSVVDPSFTDQGLPADHNVEYMGKDNILVLEDLTGKGWPKYMITVLNAPDFTPETTLAATAAKLDTYSRTLSVMTEDGSGKEDAACMVMSTSAYFDGTDHHTNTYPYVTELDEDDFKLTPELAVASGNAVKVYVERLAAKVQLYVDAEPDKTLTDGRKLYKLDESVAGKPNDEGGNTEASTDLYLEVIGWSLNGTATKAHMSKQLLAGWQSAAPFTAWNVPAFHRSYWAKGALYDDRAFAEGNEMPDVTEAIATNPDALGLVYGTFNANTRKAGEYDYCNEHTSAAASLFVTDADGNNNVLPNQTTHVILKTRICDDAGNAIDMIRYHNVLYTEEAYINYMLSKIENGSKDNLNFYTFTGTDADDKTHYKQIDATAFEPAADGSGLTGHITLKAKAGLTLYSWDATTGKMVSADVTALQTAMDAVQPAVDSDYPAVSYNDGMNVYYIPVEHQAAAADKGKIVEGYYGVVRNHWYRMNISSFTHVGHGVFDPDEKVKSDKEEDPLYYLGVNINILSWKIVDQSVEL